MNIRPIKTDEDHAAALKRIEELMNAKPGTPEGDELDILVTLVDAYESEHFPIDPPDPVSAIRFRMEQMGLRQVDIAPLLGGRSRASEILKGKRGLTLRMIRKLHNELGIPLESLVGVK